MGYRPQVRSHGSAGRGSQAARREKAKAKRQHKHGSGGKYVEEEKVVSAEEIVQKTLSRLSNLGGQTFALSPFSEYFDDWLMSLSAVLSEFESNPAVNVDDQFVKERSQILTDVERGLAERRLVEAALGEDARALSDANHLLVQIDTEYAEKTREIGLRRNKDVERQTKTVHDLEEELERISQTKTSIFRFSNKAKAQKMAEATQKLNSAKSRLELTLQNFTVEQEKLHDEYEKKKETVIEQVRNLEKQVANLEIDGSFEIRGAACEALTNAVNSLLQRKTS